MTTPHVLASLVRHTQSLWWRWFPLLVAWFLAGWAIRTAATHVPVMLGTRSP